MGSDKQPITIKKYANRRLYNTGTSTYVTLEDLADMVKKGDDFVVFDAKSGEEITRSVLTQIIFEQEGKGDQSLLPITFLRQLIRFYGDSMQMLVPSYLEFTVDRLKSDQEKFRDQFAGGLDSTPFGGQTRNILGAVEEQTRKNMAMFSQALSMFNPFAAAAANAPQPGGTTPPPYEPAPPPPPSSAPAAKPERDDLEDMRRQLDELQKKLEGILPKKEG